MVKRVRRYSTKVASAILLFLTHASIRTVTFGAAGASGSCLRLDSTCETLPRGNGCVTIDHGSPNPGPPDTPTASSADSKRMATAAATIPLSPDQLRDRISSSAIAFRGYNNTNLGRSPELLAHPRYGPVLRKHLQIGSMICEQFRGRKVDLVARVEQKRETSLATYDEALAMIVAVEVAQLEMLRESFQIDHAKSHVMYGFSLGEIAALVASGLIEFEQAMRIPLTMSPDAVELARDISLGVLFSRGGALPQAAVHALCNRINLGNDGIIGVSAYLAPNAMLLIGQNGTLEEFTSHLKELGEERIYLRKNQHRWPPLHTPIVWQRQITDRARTMMHAMPCNPGPPRPQVFSMVTGKIDYSGANTRDIVGDWIDHPQRLWDAINYTFSKGLETVIHVGPQPNIIPATFNRLASNVESQTKGRIRMRALSNIVSRPWLKALLPKRTSLLRAPFIRHVRLEDWLLAQGGNG